MKRLHAFTLAEGATHVDISGNIRRVAFTLAEVLITLAIIGVVAALTIPTLVTNYQKKSYVTSLQKSYSQLLNGFKLMAASEGVEYLADTQFIKDLEMEDGFVTNMTSILNSVNKNFTKYFRIANACFGENENDCPMYKVSYTNLNGTTDNEFGPNYQHAPYFKLQDGTTVFIFGIEGDKNFMLIYLGVDINGEKGPNIIGRDLFYFLMLTDYRYQNDNYVHSSIGIMLEPYDSSNDLNDCGVIGSSDISEATGIGCFDRIFEEGWKMNY